MKSFGTDGAKAWVMGSQFRMVVALAVAVLLLFLAFESGVAFGFHRAEYGYHLDENYGRTFGAPGNRFMPPGTGFPGGHGAIGKIVSVSGSTIMVASVNGPEQQITLDDDTMIRNQNGTASTSLLVTGDSVVIFGEPTDNGGIHARLIRIVPSTMTAATSTHP
ncbi:MAG: hypothetical protein JWL88_28 [Parcubacteria group bacterium]|nr:hypothetical protein [Parcubacteria group bacterium]